jgi:sec-independent protein translocase protein TatA
MQFGAPELLIVLVIIILLFGVGRISGVAGEIGKSIHEFRKGLQGDGENKDKSESETNKKA